VRDPQSEPIGERAPAWRAPWTLRTLFIASVAGPLAIFAAVSWQHYRNIEREAYDQVRHTLGLFREQAQRVFDIYDLVLDRVGDAIQGLSWDQIGAREPELHQRLRRIRASVEQVGNLLLVDPSGSLTVSTAISPPPALNNRDRGYFRGLMDESVDMYVDAAVRGRVTGRVIFNVSRRRPSATGAFDGVMALASEQEYWQRFFSGLDSSLSPSISLVRAEGDTLIRLPEVEFGQARPSEEFLRRVRENDEGYYDVISRADGSRRLIGYSKLPGVPVYAVYTVSAAAVLSRWRADSLTLGGVTLAAIAALLTITFLLRQRIHSEWRLQTELAESNRNLESNVARRTEELTRALRDKDVLLKEVHHRVKNNLQMIASLVRIGAKNVTPEALPIFRDIARRIITVGQAYNQLYAAPELDLLDLGAYIGEVCEQVAAAAGSERIALAKELQPIGVDIDVALPIGLIAGELVTNAYKHAFPGGAEGRIRVRLARDDGSAVLTVSDNGRGLPEGRGGDATGLRLVDALASQIDGRVEFIVSAEGGTECRLTFTPPER
jgi:two-component sensor histidine kinase